MENIPSQRTSRANFHRREERNSPEELRPNGSIEESVEERVDEEGAVEEPFREMSQRLQYLRFVPAHLNAGRRRNDEEQKNTKRKEEYKKKRKKRISKWETEKRRRKDK